MQITGYDYSFAKPDVSSLIKAGAGFVGRYVGGDPAKTLTSSEFIDLSSNYLPVVLIHETTADWMLEGAASGAEHARQARAGATVAGVPGKVPIYAACDFPATAEQIPSILDTLAGFAGELGKAYAGLYGPLAAVKAAADSGYRTIQTSAWSQGQWDVRDEIKQTGKQVVIGGVTVDVDQAVSFDFGQYTPPPPPWYGQQFAYHPTAPQLHSVQVLQWQRRMADRGWKITVDGWYGEQSATVCSDFQTEFAKSPAPGLAVDGIVGPATWAASYTIPITS